MTSGQAGHVYPDDTRVETVRHNLVLNFYKVQNQISNFEFMCQNNLSKMCKSTLSLGLPEHNFGEPYIPQEKVKLAATDDILG